MLFPTIEFGVFFVVILIYSWGIRKSEFAWKLFILGASYYFYGNWDVRFLGLIIFVSITNYLSSVLLYKSKDRLSRKLYLWMGICISLGVLGYFKYYNFFVDNFSLLFGLLFEKNGISPLEIVLPVGISFFTFQAISYLVDVYREEVIPDISIIGFINFLSYIAFFPQLVAGPIVRSTVFLPQFKSNYTNNIKNYNIGIFLILSGLIKKLIISTYLQTHIVDSVLNAPLNYAPVDVILAIYGFSVQIFCDFSGYSDIAIGVAFLLGFEFPENFNSPYKALNIQDFWRRWHISLSTWLRDYLYIPLGGNRKGETRTNINIVITMLLGGLWHGASISFIIWGGLHGIGILFHRIWMTYRDRIQKIVKYKNTKIGKNILKVISTIITFNFVSFAWIFFYHREFETAFSVIKSIFNISKKTEGINLYVLLYIIVGISLNYLEIPIKNLYIVVQNIFPGYLQFISNATIFLLIVQMSPDIVPPFIYFKF